MAQFRKFESVALNPVMPNAVSEENWNKLLTFIYGHGEYIRTKVYDISFER